jgi:hypothetical protein
MIAGGFEWVEKIRENRPAVVMNSGGFAVDDVSAVDDCSAVRRAEGLVAEACRGYGGLL